MRRNYFWYSPEKLIPCLFLIASRKGGNMYLLNQKSLQNLQGVHPSLVELMKTAIISSPFPFIIAEGLRSMERQKQLFQEGKAKDRKSTRLNSSHANISYAVFCLKK